MWAEETWIRENPEILITELSIVSSYVTLALKGEPMSIPAWSVKIEMGLISTGRTLCGANGETT